MAFQDAPIESLISVIVISVILITLISLHYVIGKMVREQVVKERRAMSIKKTLNVSFIIFLGLSLALIWGIKVNNLLVFLTSFITLIAIGFFAVWSILSNILAGVLLFFTGAIRVGDTIEVLPEKVKGTVKKINALFVELEDSKGNEVVIPNSLFFQRFIKKKK